MPPILLMPMDRHETDKQVDMQRGYGPRRTVCLNMATNGLGDNVHAMPGVFQKVRDGYQVTVYTQEWYRSMFERIGAKVITTQQEMGWIDENIHNFEYIYSLKQWSLCEDLSVEPPISRFELFARCIGVTLPKRFDWAKVFMPIDLYVDAESNRPIICAPYSESIHRSYMRGHALKLELEKAFDEPIITTGPIKWQSWQPSFRDLTNLIASSKLVVTVDTGTLALALAVGTPVVVIVGPNDERTYAEQFRRYVDVNLRVLRAGDEPHHCMCRIEEGRGVEHCIQYAECMADVSTSEIVNACREMLGGGR